LSKIIVHGSVKIGLLHGHQIIPYGDASAVQAVARQLDVDVLISGHSHMWEVVERDGKLYVNPGSATGAYSSFSASEEHTVPSFLLMDIQGTQVTTYVYQEVQDEVKVEKVEYRKR
jgi:vacuolar protein sorting-associated protein 29